MSVATRLTGREFRLAARPDGEPRPSDLELVATEVPDLVDGQVLIRNTWMSLAPYMRGRMDDVASHTAPFALSGLWRAAPSARSSPARHRTCQSVRR